MRPAIPSLTGAVSYSAGLTGSTPRLRHWIGSANLSENPILQMDQNEGW